MSAPLPPSGRGEYTSSDSEEDEDRIGDDGGDGGEEEEEGDDEWDDKGGKETGFFPYLIRFSLLPPPSAKLPPAPPWRGESVASLFKSASIYMCTHKERQRERKKYVYVVTHTCAHMFISLGIARPPPPLPSFLPAGPS